MKRAPTAVGDGVADRSVRRLGYQPALDGLRAFAVIAVIVHHAFNVLDWPRGGSFGVTTFFVASGFLITVLLLQERANRSRISLARFYRRRALRLMPALVVFLAGVLAYYLVDALVRQPHGWDALRENALGAFAGIFYFTNILIGYDVGFGVPITTGHLWTLATEEQFYLLWPPVLAFAARRRLGDKWLAIGLGAAIVLLAANRFALVLDDAPLPRVKYAPDTTFDSILLGCLGGVLFVNNWLPIRNARTIGAIGAVAAAACVALNVVPMGTGVQYGLGVPAYSFAALVVVLAAVTAPRSLVNRGLSTRPLVFVGRISYALFLWQQLCIFALAERLTVPVAVALAFVLAYASYVLVERPFLELKRRDRAQLEDQSTGLESSPPVEAPADKRPDLVDTVVAGARAVAEKWSEAGRNALYRLDDGRVIVVSPESARNGFKPPPDGAKTVVCTRCSRTQEAGSWTSLRLSHHTRATLAGAGLLEPETCFDCRTSRPTPVAA
jgi:peptidoglycan/LPS O-acetylase OafA/YrhL